MKTIPWFILLGSLLLGGCVFIDGGRPTPVSSFVFESSWVRTSDNRPVICDNRLTRYAYSFEYAASVNPSSLRWTETYVGEVTGEVQAPATRTISDASVDTAARRITVTLEYAPGVAPLGTISPNAIVISPVPPAAEIGRTRLEIRVSAPSDMVTRSFVYPVFGNCP